MGKVQRIGVSLEPELLDWFDGKIAEKGYTNRSEAIRDLIREQMVEDQWQGDEECVAAVTLVYDHHGDLGNRLTHLQHHSFVNVISTLHVHIDHDNCLEVLVLKGPGKQIQKMGDKLISLRGIKHGKMITTTTGSNLP
jgi:CopG family transcriptional regulator, nickel-responsive regulator